MLKSQAEAEAYLARQVQEVIATDELGRTAAASPFPGPLRDIFASQPSRQVGPYMVRPFYDLDVETLTRLQHPMAQIMIDGMAGIPTQVQFIPRGQPGWDLAWMMTHEPEEVDKVMESEGIKGLQQQAKKEFGKCNLAQLTAIATAVGEQIRVYVSPHLGYGAKSAEGEQSPNPTPDLALMDSAGSSKSAAA